MIHSYIHEIYYSLTINTSDSVLQAESVDLEAMRKGYEFPVVGEVVGLDTANGSEATISIPQELLLARANGMLKCLLFLQFIHIYTCTFDGTNVYLQRKVQ